MANSLACTPGLGRKRLHNIGTTVKETMADTKIAKETTTANSLNSRPIGPDIKKRGINTAIKEIEIEIMVKPTSLLPFREALRGSIPFSI